MTADHAALRRARRRLGPARPRAGGRGGLRRAPARLRPVRGDRGRDHRGHGRDGHGPARRPSRPRGCGTGCGPRWSRPSRCRRAPAAAEPVGRRRPAGPRSRPEPRRRRAPRSPLAAGAAPVLVAAGVAAIVGLGIWNVVLTADRQRPAGDRRGAERRHGRAAGPGQATVAPLSGTTGERSRRSWPAATRCEVVTHGLAPNDAEAPTYVLWGMGGERAEAARHLRRGRGHRWSCGP